MRLWKSGRRASIRIVMIFAMIVVAFIPLITFFVYNNINVTQMTMRRMQEYSNQIVRQAGSSVDALIAQIKATQRQLTSNAITSVLFQNYSSKSAKEKLDMVRTVDQTLADAKRSNVYISQIYMVSEDEMLFSSNTDVDAKAFLESEWIHTITQINAGTMIVPTHQANYYNRNANLSGKPPEILVVSLLSKILHYGRNDAIALIQTDIQYSAIEDIMKKISLGDSGFVMIVDGNDKLVYCHDKSFIGKSKDEYLSKTTAHLDTDRTDLAEVSESLNEADWHIVGFVPTENVMEEMAPVKQFAYIIAGFMFLFIILVSTKLSSLITQPITSLTSQMEQVGKGDFKIMEEKSFYSETSVLTQYFNQMVEDIDALIRSNIQKEEEKNRSEFIALQNQINPHFLYNTLNSIKWMALMENNKPIAEAIVELVKMLQFSCSNKNTEVTVAEDMEFIKSYVFIQKMRYGSSIETIYEIDESILSCLTLKFILQPIVENAIIHGFSDVGYSGTIIVKGEDCGDSITFSVKDNGKGMKLDKGMRFTGVGMDNVQKRLRFHYGNKSDMKVESTPGGGTIVTLRLPKILSEEGEQNAQGTHCG